MTGPAIATNLTPHMVCIGHDPVLWKGFTAVHALTALSYYLIPACIVVFWLAGDQRPHGFWRVSMGSSFILACGTYHVLSMLTIYDASLYYTALVVGYVMAAISVASGVIYLNGAYPLIRYYLIRKLSLWTRR